MPTSVFIGGIVPTVISWVNFSEADFRLKYTKLRRLLESPGYITLSNDEVEDTFNGFLTTVNKFVRRTQIKGSKTIAIDFEFMITEMCDVPVIAAEKFTQEITVGTIPPINTDVGIIDLTTIFSVSSGLPLRFKSSNDAVAFIDGNNAEIMDKGRVTIIAQQDGNEFFYPAEDTLAYFISTH